MQIIPRQKRKEEKMKKLITYTIMILCVTAIIAVIPTEAEGAIYEDTVRLHILANSDSDEDQELKIKLRDDILTEFATELSAFESADAAKESLGNVLPKIEDFSEEKIKEYGYSYSVAVTLTEEWYDTREYENFTLPCGYYTSLRVIIGDGEGKNWWCVMYPPLCLDMALEKAPADDGVKKYSDSEFNLISGNGYKAKFKIMEIISGIFS